MGVRGAVARAAAGRAHVLLVEVPGRPRLRVEAERVLARRGWVVADSPADADVLLVCGPVEGRLAEAVERTWDGLPGPRARVDLPDGTGEAGLAEALEDARARLLDLRHQDEDASGRAPAPPEDVAADAGDMAPDGVPLAGNDDADRDGLEMDVLHLPLGPVLRHWPAGLVLRATLGGDVVTRAEVEVLTATAPSDARAHALTGSALLCDAAAGVLALAGARSAVGARRARDAAVDGDLEQARVVLGRVDRRVRRSRLLRWMLGDAGRIGPREGVPTDLAGDVHDRLLGLLERAAAGLGTGPRDQPPAASEPVSPDVLGELVVGRELAEVRLLVATLAPDLDLWAAAREQEASGA